MGMKVGSEYVAEVVKVKLSALKAPDGAHLQLHVTFQTSAWPRSDRGVLSLILHPADVVARIKRTELRLGLAHPNPIGVLTPFAEATLQHVRYVLPITSTALNAVESARDGRELELLIDVGAHPLLEGEEARSTQTRHSTWVPRDEWLDALRSCGLSDTVVVELPMPKQGPSSTAAARQRLLRAVEARDAGSHAEAVARCRLALDELENVGMRGKAPKEVAQFLLEYAGKLTQRERFGALQAVANLLLSPAHHAKVPEEDWAREDADLAIVITAAITKMATRWLGTGPDSGEQG